MDNFEFVYELNRAANSLNSYVDACIAERSGLTRAQCIALILIEASPDSTKAALARKLNCSHVAAGRLVTILSHKGYITTTPSKQNPHAINLRATTVGMDVIKQVRIVFGQQSAKLFSHVASEVDIDLLASQLHTFTEILSSYR